MATTDRGLAVRPVIEALGDQALLIVLGRVVDPAVNRRVCLLARDIQRARIRGVTDVVPSFAAVAVHYIADAVRRVGDELPDGALRRQLAPLLARMAEAEAKADDDGDGDGGGDREGRADGPFEADAGIIDIPMYYGGEYGPDLEEAAHLCNLSVQELIDLHRQPTALRVYMIGFAPGAPYIGLLDRRLSLPRRTTPRLLVPAGTVAIANRQCIIYPVDGPGGWNLIGRTPLTLFDPTRNPPALLAPGSLVRFQAIDAHGLAAGSPPQSQ